MNRKARRALKGGKHSANAALSPNRPVGLDDIVSQAGKAYQEGQFAQARDICRQALARNPSHIAANHLMGVAFQALGRDKNAVEHFARAIALDDSNAMFHHNIGFSLQRMNMWDEAVAHFNRAIALKMDGRPIEDFVAQYPAISSCLNRIAQQWPRRLTIESLFGSAGVGPVADDAFLRCALETTVLCSVELETFLAATRFALLQVADKAAPEFGGIDDKVLGFYAALAQQCFINEYVLAQSDDETRQAEGLRSALAERAAADGAIPSLLLIVVAVYFPLHRLPEAASLRARTWPPVLDGLLRQQLFEPFEEAALRSAIPSLTAIEDGVSAEVKEQYEENPYPRWTMIPDVSILGDWRTRFPARADDSGLPGPRDILVAGCGTGQNPIQTALKFPEARVLAVDLSTASLAYAVRKTREAGIQTIEYAEADILKLGSIGRSFDRIDAIGILHHLSDPRAGWRVLLSLLRPGCIMDIGLYSQTARRAVVEARAFIAAHGFRATIEDIRRFRRELLVTSPSFAKYLVGSPDFYTASGCRDLLFHVMEHRFTIPEISNFLSENGLTFLGFRLGHEVFDQFGNQFPGSAALTDLNCWHTFEQANPQTFASMYRFAVRKAAT